MSSGKNFQEKSYEQHAEHFREYGEGGALANHAKTWFENDTVDAWRHQRMYACLNPILAAEPDAKWLTVGDGRYGKDAKYILDQGSDALATDISDVLLKEASDLGYISKYKKENSESLSFKESEFDYVFCKESYHHFPRPMQALYEMLRVADKGVVLIEPNDVLINDKILNILFRNFKNTLKRLLGKDVSRHAFEVSGNYLYGISRREIEKVALGLNYKTVAFKGVNDAYLPNVEFEKISSKGPLQNKIKKTIGRTDLLCKLGLTDYGLLTALILKKEPSQKLLQKLADEGYEILHLPENPYISK